METTKYEKREGETTVVAGHNFDKAWSHTDRSRAVYLKAGLDVEVGAAISPDEARKVAAALVETADEFDRLYEEATKPKLPTKVGAVILVGGCATRMLSYGGKWLSPGGPLYTTEQVINAWGTDFEVLYEGFGE